VGSRGKAPDRGSFALNFMSVVRGSLVCRVPANGLFQQDSKVILNVHCMCLELAAALECDFWPMRYGGHSTVVDFIGNIVFSTCRWNSVAYGVAFMGRFKADDVHCKAAVDAAQLLFRYLRKEGRLAEDFTVYGLRQVRPFESPSMELYNVIKQWPQWVCLYYYRSCSEAG
jgi:hypothetical protein